MGTHKAILHISKADLESFERGWRCSLSWLLFHHRVWNGGRVHQKMAKMKFLLKLSDFKGRGFQIPHSPFPLYNVSANVPAEVMLPSFYGKGYHLIWEKNCLYIRSKYLFHKHNKFILEILRVMVWRSGRYRRFKERDFLPPFGCDLVRPPYVVIDSNLFSMSLSFYFPEIL